MIAQAVGVDTSTESANTLDCELRRAAALGYRVLVVHGMGLLEVGHSRQRSHLAALVDAAGPKEGGTEFQGGLTVGRTVRGGASPRTRTSC